MKNLINSEYETITTEMFLVQDILEVLTQHDLLKITRAHFCSICSIIFSRYMEMPSYNLKIIDNLISLVGSIETSQDQQVDFTYLKTFLVSFIRDNRSIIGELIILGSYKSYDYERMKNNFKQNMIAFLRDFVDDSQFSVWYIDTKTDLVFTK